MKISKAELSESLMGYAFDEVKNSNVFTSKAPTPEFGIIPGDCFDGIIDK